MPNFLTNLPHLIMATIVIAAATVLASLHVITGGEAIALIGAGAGFSLGTSAASTSVSAANTTVRAASDLTSAGTHATTAANLAADAAAHPPAL